MSRMLRLVIIFAVAGSPCVALTGCSEEKPITTAPPTVAAGKQDPGPPTAFSVKPAKRAKHR